MKQEIHKVRDKEVAVLVSNNAPDNFITTLFLKERWWVENDFKP